VIFLGTRLSSLGAVVFLLLASLHLAIGLAHALAIALDFAESSRAEGGSPELRLRVYNKVKITFPLAPSVPEAALFFFIVIFLWIFFSLSYGPLSGSPPPGARQPLGVVPRGGLAALDARAPAPKKPTPPRSEDRPAA
jgi:hypothetical protein